MSLIDISEQKVAQHDLRTANTLLEKRQKEIESDLASRSARVQQSLAPKCSGRGAAYGSKPSTSQYVRLYIWPGHPLDEDHLNVLVCDVSGHGISSALIANSHLLGDDRTLE